MSQVQATDKSSRIWPERVNDFTSKTPKEGDISYFLTNDPTKKEKRTKET